MKQFFVIITLFASICSFAQSGYMGKKYYLGYENGFSVALKNPTYHAVSNYSSGISFNTTHELSIHKITSRKHEFAPFYNFHRSAFRGKNLGSSNALNKIVCHSVGLNFRFYTKSKKRWNIAPIGNYFDFKPFVTNTSINLNSKAGEVTKLFNVQTPGLAFGFGRQGVVMNSMTVSYGLQFSLPFNVFKAGFVQDGGYGDLSNEPEYLDEYYISSAIIRNFTKTMFELKIGIGFLAF